MVSNRSRTEPEKTKGGLLPGEAPASGLSRLDEQAVTIALYAAQDAMREVPPGVKTPEGAAAEMVDLYFAVVDRIKAQNALTASSA